PRQHLKRSDRFWTEAGVEIGDAVLGFCEGTDVFIPQPQVQRQFRKNPPVILNETIVRIRAKLVIGRSRLQAGLLRQAQQEVRKIVSCPWNRLRASRQIFRGGKTREYETAFGISRGTEALQDPPVIPAETHIMFSVVPDHRIGDGVSLVEFSARNRPVE